MFSKLKDKLKSWLGKPSEASKIEEKPKKSEKPIINKKQKKKIKEEPKKDTLKLSETKDDSSLKTEAIPKETKTSFFSKIKTKFTTDTITQKQIDEFFEPLELILLENNVALEVADKIKENLSKDLIGLSVKKGEIEKTINESLKSSISEVLIEPPDLMNEIKNSLEPYIIIFFGINGTGKTTTIAKLAHKLKSSGISCILAAADTFRAAAIEQLEIHANNLKIPIIKGQYNADPTSIAFDAKKYAEKHKIKCVLIDTAGRMYTKENLIKQMEKIIRIIKPNLKIFVGESITGNDAITQAKEFSEAVGIDGIILSKADVDEKGGTILSVPYIIKKPIYFLGTGQSYEDLQEFKKDLIIKNLGLD